MALLTTWLGLEPLYLAQLGTYTGAMHRELFPLAHLGLKLTFILPSSPVFTSIVNKFCQLGQSEAQLSKLVNKSTCWENASPSLVASVGLEGDSPMVFS